MGARKNKKTVLKTNKIKKQTHADLAHLVERHLAKVEVAGSSPVIRSKEKSTHLGAFFFGSLFGAVPLCGTKPFSFAFRYANARPTFGGQAKLNSITRAKRVESCVIPRLDVRTNTAFSLFTFFAFDTRKECPFALEASST